MRPSPKIKKALQYTTLSLGLLIGVLAFSGVKTVPSDSLSGRLLPQEQRRGGGEVPIIRFTADRVHEGFTVPADSHVFFTIPEGTNVARNVFFGPENDARRYWGYCFKGDEAMRKKTGKVGMEIYHKERFFYSLGERRAQGNKPKPSDADSLIPYARG